MAINKVIYGDTALVDLTNDTVTPESLLSGVTAHQADGTLVVGTLDTAWHTFYSGGNTFRNDVGVPITLHNDSYNLSDCSLISIMTYDSSYTSGTRSRIMIDFIGGFASATYYPIAYGNTFDIIRLEVHNDQLTILSRRNATELMVGAVYGKR